MIRPGYYMAQLIQAWAKRKKDATGRISRHIAQAIEASALSVEAAILCIGARNRIEPDLWRALGYGDVVAVDLLPSPGVRFADMHRLPFPARSFDMVFASHAFEHAYDAPQALREAVRVLKRPGWLFAAFPTNFRLNAHDRWDFKSARGFSGLLGREGLRVSWSEDRDGESAVLALVP